LIHFALTKPLKSTHALTVVSISETSNTGPVSDGAALCIAWLPADLLPWLQAATAVRRAAATASDR
jgi:hypothetical protein